MISKETLKGLRPIPKKLPFKMLDTEGKETEIVFEIHPYTVDEKLELEQERKIVMDLKDTDPEFNKITEAYMKKSIFYILRKTIKDLEEKEVDELVLPEWLEEIYWKAMEFEGVTESVRKKVMGMAVGTEGQILKN